MHDSSGKRMEPWFHPRPHPVFFSNPPTFRSSTASWNVRFCRTESSVQSLICDCVACFLLATLLSRFPPLDFERLLFASVWALPQVPCMSESLPNFQHPCVRFSAFALNFKCAGVCSCPWQYCYFAAFSCFLFSRCIYFLPGCIASILFLLLTNNSNLFCKMLEA